MGAPARWKTLIILALIFMAIQASAVRVAVISLQQACGGNSSIYLSEGSTATICATVLYIDGSPTLPRSVVVTLVATDITAQYPNDYSPKAINVTFPSGSVEGQNACSDFLVLNDPIVEITESFSVMLTTSDSDVTIGNCDGIGVPSFTIYIKGNNSLQPSMPVQALFPTPTIACSQTLSAIFCDCPISSSPIATPTTTPTPSDRTPPVLTFVRNPLSSNQDITITWIFNKPVNAHCTLLSPSYVALPFPCSTSFSITNLMAGEYTLFIYAIDLVGSYVLEVSHSWIVDLTPPLVYIASYPPASTYRTDWPFAFYCSNKISCSYQCSVQLSSSPEHYLPCNNGYFLASNLQNGQSYAISVFAIDGVGNLGSPSRYTWTVDTIAPTIQSLNNFTVSCGNQYDPSVTGTPGFSDNIDPNPSLTYSDNFVSMCTVNRVWKVADAAGNSAQTIQVISFINLQPPGIVAPSDSYVPCAYIQDALQSINPAGVLHPCNRPFTRTYSDSYFPQQCGVNFVRTWTVVDDCGQIATFAQNIHILAQQLPAGPVYNQINVNLNAPLGWPSYVTAIYCYVFIWVQGTSQPAQPVAVVNSANYVPSTSYAPGTTIYWQIQFFVSNSNFVPSPVWGFQTKSYPDLSVTVVSLPSSAFSGQQIQVSWTVTNIGSSNTGIYGWRDGIYIGGSTDLASSTLVNTVYIPTLWLDPQQSYSRSITVSLGRNYIGTYYAFVATDMYQQIDDVNRYNNRKISSNPMNVVRKPTPDLVVDSISTQSLANSGTYIRITWIVRNDGVGATDATSWYDRVYWSTDQNLDGYDRIIGTYRYSGSLIPQGSYQQTITFFIPNAIFGNYYILVYTDIYNYVYEYTSDNNNIGTSPYLQIVLSPTPDFVVSQIQCQDTYRTADTMRISYTVSNFGPGKPFEIFWQDALKLTSVSTGSNYIFNVKGHYGTIYPGGSYTNQITYYIGAYVPTGSYVITAFADYYNNVFEYNAEGNNYGTKYITITQALSNLVPFGVTYSVTTDTIGNTLQLSFNVQDVGTGPATNTPWGDRVGISYLPSLYYGYTTFLGSFVQNYVLLPNGGYYTRSLTTKVPNSIFGNVYLFVQVDYTNRVYESNKQDNIYTIGPFAMPIVLPDLSVSSFSVDSSSPPLYAGTTVVFDWTVTNVGTGTAQGVWRDSFYLGSTPLASPYWIKLADVTVAATLQPTAGYYSRSASIQLPSNNFGSWYISVNADNYRTINENSRLSNNMAVLLLNILQPPTADLRVSVVNYNFVPLQRVLTVFWSVVNDGSSMVATASWVDEIFLSVSPVLSPYNSISIGRMVVTARLLSHQQYSKIKTIILPPTIYGAYYLLIKTDSYNSIMELNGESNNAGSAGISYFSPPPSPKLQINFNIGYLPTVLNAGSQVLVTYSVTNIGDYAITAGSWTDGIYFSSYSTNRYLVMSQGLLIKRVLHAQQLNVGQTYYVSTYINVPYRVNNFLYLALIIDISGRLGNPSLTLTNVVAASVLPFLIQDGSLPDLSVTAASSVSVTSGQPAVISYTVSNVGQKDALGVWYETLYLSVDASLDPFDTRLGTVKNLRYRLPFNSAYAQNVNVFIPLGLVNGKYYLFYQVDGGNRIAESDKNNNVISNVITIVGTVSVDIAVTQVQTFPQVVHFGNGVTFQWKVRNNGAALASGYECDTLYLSRDAVWDAYDYVIGTPPCRNIAIQPYQNNAANDQTFSYTYTVPFISEGSYVGIVRIQTNIRDGNLQNNIGYAINQLQVVSQTQFLNTPTVHPLITGTQILYKITNVPVKNTLIANLVIIGSSAYHNVYLNYRSPPTTSIYDGYSRVLLSSQQKAVVTNTKGGDYFISVQSFGSIIATYSITFVVQIANFEIFQISPSLGTPYGKTTIRFYGTQFSNYIAASIYSNTFGEMNAINIYWYSSVELYATFDLSTVAPGLYSMRLTNTITRNIAQLNDCFRVTVGIPGQVSVQASVIQTSRNTQTATMTIHASNTGGTDMITPLVLIKGPSNSVVQLMGGSMSTGSSSTLGVFLQPRSGPAGFVSPGVSVDLQFSVFPPISGADAIQIIQIQNSIEPHPYIVQKQMLQPVAIPSTVWDLIWNNFVLSLGDTWSTLYRRASEIATMLSLVLRQEYVLDTIVNYQLQVSHGLLTGNSIVSVGDLYGNFGTHLQLSLERKYSSYIHKRRTAGPLGMGWLLGWWERRLQFIDSRTIMMWNERETMTFVSNGAEEFYFNNDMITVTSYGFIYVDSSSNLRYSFDSSSGNLFEINSVQDSSSIQFTYINGTLNYLTHSNGQKLNITYDEEGHIAQMDMLDSTNTVIQTSLYTYDPSGLYLVAVTIGNLTTAYSYNDKGDLANILYSTGNRKVFEYDETNLLCVVKSYSNTSGELFSITRTNNWNGNVLLTIQPRNTSTEITYDTAGRIASYSTNGGMALVELINSSGRLIYFGGELILHQYLEDGYWRLTNANGDTASYKFDEYNQLLVFIDRNGNSYTSTYNNVNKTATSLQYPDLTNITLIYDTNGNISSIVNRDGTVSNYAYDSLGNLIQKQLDNDITMYGYSTSKQLIQATNMIGSVNITYDSSGAPIQIAYPNGHKIGYSYDSGRRTSMSIDDGYSITYQYDTSGTHVTQINLLNGTSTSFILVQFSYYSSGKIQRKTLGNQQYTTYKYMGLKGRLSEMNTFTSNDHLLSSYIYQYDDEGRVVSVITLSGTFNYSYDGIGQLTGWTNPSGETTLFTYDGNGNRVSEVTNGVKATYVANVLNQYLQYNETDSFVFDQNGNLKRKTTTDGTQYFNFNSESKLVETHQDILRCSYQYDAMGNLFRKNCSDLTVYDYIIDPFGRTGSDIILESLNGEPTFFIHCPSTGLVALIDTSISYYHFDPVGSVTHLVGSNDGILNTYKYDPFGRVLQQSEQKRNPYQYAGQHGVTKTYELDNMYVMPSGHYYAHHGRFINTDVEGTHRSLQNAYSYSLNSPLLQLNPADSTLTAVLSELLVGSNSSVLLYSLTADLSGDPFWKGSDIIQGAFALKGSFSNTLGNRNILPAISTVVGPQKENSIDGTAIPSTSQFQIISKTPPLAGAPLQRTTSGSLQSQQSAGPTGPLVIMVPSSILANVTQNYTGNIITVPASSSNTSGQDPNEVIGTMGIGDAHFVSSSTTLKYTVYFENNQNASLPAQRVQIVSPLDNNLDLRTFSLEQIAFSTFTSESFLNMANIETTYDATKTSGVLVHVKGGVNLTNQQASWEFQALDPVTGQPPLDQSVGFLPPNNGTTGQGYVSFTIMAYNQTGGLVQINSSAQITFDQTEPYDTQPFLNTIDDIAPTVKMSILGIADTNQSVVLQIESSDVGSGVARTSIYEVTGNGTVSFLMETTATMAVVQLSSYSSKLLGIPLDNVGNMPSIEEQMGNLLVLNISSVEGVCPGNCLGNGMCTSYGVCICNSGFIGQNCSEDINECAGNNTLGPCEQICTNTIGSFYCSCHDGYLLSGYNCTDIDECAIGNNSCSQICNNTIGHYICSCMEGYLLSVDNSTCNDIDECVENGGRGRCDQRCTNTNGSFFCSCRTGYTLSGNICNDINECAINNGLGPCGQICSNTNGSYICSCQSGFLLSGNVCYDINECMPNGGRGPCDQICTNTDGSFNCSCQSGYSLSGYNCFDINECLTNQGLGPCAQICTNTAGSFLCSCLSGFATSGNDCNDIDECTAGNNNCSQICDNPIGSYNCRCMAGYMLLSDNRTCIDINECSMNGGKGQCDQICTNTIGSFTCSCQVGYSILGFACNDINECVASNGGLGPCNQICTNTNGSFICSCLPGYLQTGYNCYDINECLSNGGRGACDQICTNTDGSFNCSCQSGYSQSGYNCSDINECLANGGLGPCAQICNNTIGSFVCRCQAGFTAFGNDCTDINECTSGISGCSQTCDNTIGGYTCGCYPGYGLSMDNKSCIVINQCAKNFGKGDCDQICTSTNGSFYCSCLSGFSLNGNNCNDINECASNGGHGPCDQYCTNTNGSFYCSCQSGFTQSGYMCNDINECAPNGGRGECEQMCTNTNGSYYCSCQTGYTLSEYSCNDINECTPNNGLGPCGQICTNTNGSFYCSCKQGYDLSGYSCNDIDECALQTSGCNQICANTNGSFVCSCNAGFQMLPDNKTCTDINECVPNGGHGPCDQICTNTPGSFSCSCQSGYDSIGWKCMDINECLPNEGQGPCNQICTNTNGSFTCSCQPGYTQNGYNCIDINECTPNGGRGPCDQLCTNTIGAFYCSCSSGYILSVYNCSDINECAPNNGKGPCSQMCSNTIGSFFCSCDAGYSLMGYDCYDINECMLGVSGCTQLCNNTIGGFKCGCNYRFELSSDNKTCSPVNACLSNGGRGPCEQFCINESTCSCLSGYEISGYNCLDINECASNGGLGPCDQICTNTNGSFFCSCRPGYTLSGYTCNDINECMLNGGRGPCDQICVNTDGSFNCSCQIGYISVGYNCSDVNECNPNGGHGPCEQICRNEIGSYMCSCNPGFALNGYSCDDIDECLRNTSGCAQACNNTIGSFSCSCNSGYELSSNNKSCNDINECMINGGLGPCDQMCSNNPGSFSCSCATGFVLSGFVCNDINECAPNGGLGPCDQQCINTNGSFSCDCLPGYVHTLSQYSCSDINECTPNGGRGACSQICINTNGTFSCSCNPGFTQSGYACNDINECASNGGLGPCSQICVNTIGAFSCGCQSGYILSGYNCNDIDECNLGTSGCSQECMNTNGTFLCLCYPGYQLSSDNKTCIVTNECASSNEQVRCQELCIPTNGSFRCDCQSGYSPSGYNCSDIDECASNGGQGPCGQICTNTIGSFSCSCQPGYTENGYNCSDKNECATNGGRGPCDQICTNTAGSFFCSCQPGYNQTGYSCVDIDECLQNGGVGSCAQNCTNTAGSFQCSCKQGYSLSGSNCFDIDECNLGISGCSQLCTNSIGSFVCSCYYGYQLTSDNKSCIVIDQCAPNGGLGPCNQICSNTNGSFFCSCRAGYSLNGYTCYDINECEPRNGLGPCNQSCTNLVGSFYCSCQSGYQPSGYNCLDINECTLGSSGCSQMCQNTYGSFLCACQTGYQLLPDNTSCIDINECLPNNGSGPCNQSCTNLVGSFSCSCQLGYQLLGYSCSDINECSLGISGCSQLCINTVSSYSCNCLTGYQLSSDNKTCLDTNECALGTSECSQLCVNTNGSFLCGCLDGFELLPDNKTCIDVDECESNGGFGPCEQICTNLNGSFNCSCQTGYLLSGFTCVDTNECALGTSECSQLCVNTNGSFLCGCLDGFKLLPENKTCIDIDECEPNGGFGPCEQICTNVNGSFNCSCQTGYRLSGFTCVDSGQHIAVVHLTGFGSKEDTVIRINLSADLSPSFVQSNFGVFLKVLPTAVTLNKGNFNGTGWAISPSDFGEVVIFPPLHYSGKLFLQATSLNGNVTDEAFLNLTIEPVANIPNLTANLRSPCYESANSTIYLNINSSLIDNDGSETLQVFIANLPDFITIPNFEQNSNGVFVITNLPRTVELRLKGTPHVNFTVSAQSEEKTNGDRAYNNATEFVMICPQAVPVTPVIIIITVITVTVACFICVFCLIFSAALFRRQKHRVKKLELKAHLVLDVKEAFQPQSVFIVINEADKHLDENATETKF